VGAVAGGYKINDKSFLQETKQRLMPNDYTGIKKVRGVNGKRWISDFKRLHTIVVMLPGGVFFEVKKSEVWGEARHTRLVYSIRTDLYKNKKEVFVITGGYIPAGLPYEIK